MYGFEIDVSEIDNVELSDTILQFYCGQMD